MSPNRRHRNRGFWDWFWGDDKYVLTNWKLRGAYVLFSAGIGLWIAVVGQLPLLLGVWP